MYYEQNKCTKLHVPQVFFTEDTTKTIRLYQDITHMLTSRYAQLTGADGNPRDTLPLFQHVDARAKQFRSQQEWTVSQVWSAMLSTIHGRLFSGGMTMTTHDSAHDAAHDAAHDGHNPIVCTARYCASHTTPPRRAWHGGGWGCDICLSNPQGDGCSICKRSGSRGCPCGAAHC